jgi:5-methylthioadenosine/S-adenosylhomocysteine deaminase
MPGLFNGHTHSGMALFRGLDKDLPLLRWLEEIIFPNERKWVSPDFVYSSALLACAEMARSGTTAFVDMYYHPESTIKAAREVGLKITAGFAITEGSWGESRLDLLEKDLDIFLEKNGSDENIIPALAPHAIYSISASTWKFLVKYAKKNKIPLLFHLAENPEEEGFSQKKYGKSVVEALQDFGVWECKTIAAHGICLNEKDIALLSKCDITITHCPDSNMKLGNEICPVWELRQAGISMALGTDGVLSNNNLDLLQEVDFAAKLQTYKKGIGKVSAQEWTRILTQGGASSLGFRDTGTLEVGKSADIIAVDISKPHALPFRDPYSHLIYSACGQDVKHVLVNGKVLLKDFKFQSIDELSLQQEVERWATKMLNS